MVDHKTGKPPEREPVSVGGGAVLQPALYALAAEVLLGQAAEGSRLDYCTQRGGFRSFDIAIDSPTRMRIERSPQCATGLPRAFCRRPRGRVPAGNAITAPCAVPTKRSVPNDGSHLLIF